MPIPWAGRRRAGPSGLIFGRAARVRTKSRTHEIQNFGTRNEELRLYAARLEEEPPGRPLDERVAARFWYHTIDLPGGVTTAGMFDHRPLVRHYGIPEDLAGKRVLDIGAWDGFWSFEFERKGAEVVALDIEQMSETDLPAGQRDALDLSGFNYRFGDGFELAKEALGSRVEKVTGNIYDLDPEKLGTFDLVHVGDVLLHLESPTRALRQILRVTRGQAMLVMAFDPKLSKSVVDYRGGWGNATWWIPSLDAAAQMVLDAGFSGVRLHKTYRLDSTDGSEGLWRAIYFASSAGSSMGMDRVLEISRFRAPHGLPIAARAAVVAAVAIGAFVGTRVIDKDGDRSQPPAASVATPSTRAKSDLSPMAIGAERAPGPNESAGPLDLSGDSGHVEERAAAITVDRALVQAGEPQVFGTQHECRDGDLVPATPLQDPNKVDSLRSDVGLPPLDESVETLTAEAEPCLAESNVE